MVLDEVIGPVARNMSSKINKREMVYLRKISRFLNLFHQSFNFLRRDQTSIYNAYFKLSFVTNGCLWAEKVVSIGS